MLVFFRCSDFLPLARAILLITLQSYHDRKVLIDSFLQRTGQLHCQTVACGKPRICFLQGGTSVLAHNKSIGWVQVSFFGQPKLGYGDLTGAHPPTGSSRFCIFVPGALRKLRLELRFPDRFIVALSKENGRRLGFRFERPQGSFAEARLSMSRAFFLFFFFSFFWFWPWKGMATLTLAGTQFLTQF